MWHGSKGQLLTLKRLFERSFDRFRDRPAVHFRDRTLTYGELDRRSARLAAVYRSLGMDETDKVGVLMENQPAFLVGQIGAIRAGVPVVPLNAQMGDEVEQVLDSADLRTILVGETFFDVVESIQRERSMFDYVVGHGPEARLPLGFHHLEGLIDRAPDEPPPVEVPPSAIAAQYYSSGTTGAPKGIVHGHRELTLNTAAHVQELDIRSGERLLVVTPLAHSAEPMVRAALCQGATVFLQRGFEPARVLETIEDHDISWTYLVPTMIAGLVEGRETTTYDTDSLETLAYGAAPIPKPILERGLEQFGQVFIQFYGLTEVPNLISVLSKSDHDPTDETALGSAGHPTQFVEVELREDAVDWEEGLGEIVVRSPYAFRGYTNEQGDDTSDWIRTGDIGRFDEMGRLHVLDRLQDVILRDGEPIYSTRVESAIQRHPAVKQVGVIGVPRDGGDAGTGTGDPPPDQSVKAVVVTREESLPELAEIQGHCRDHTGWDVPDTMDVVGKLPETPYGKIDKRALRDPYW